MRVTPAERMIKIRYLDIVVLIAILLLTIWFEVVLLRKPATTYKQPNAYSNPVLYTAFTEAR